MSIRNQYRRLEAVLERNRFLYYGLLFSVLVAVRVCYAALGGEPIGESLGQDVVFATAFVLTTAVLRTVLD